MNRMLLFFFFIGCNAACYPQPNHLFIKKGVHKKNSFSEGDRLHLQLLTGREKTGIITRLKDNLVYINGEEIPKEHIAIVFMDGKQKNRLPDIKTMLLIGAGVGLTTIGLSLNDANEPRTALLSALAIGYGPLLIKFIGGRILYALHRKKYKMGKKYRLQVFDITIPPRHSF